LINSGAAISHKIAGLRLLMASDSKDMVLGYFIKNKLLLLRSIRGIGFVGVVGLV
jgi:hypothetical protein